MAEQMMMLPVKAHLGMLDVQRVGRGLPCQWKTVNSPEAFPEAYHA